MFQYSSAPGSAQDMNIDGLELCFDLYTELQDETTKCPECKIKACHNLLTRIQSQLKASDRMSA